jgi:hypothetical protein
MIEGGIFIAQIVNAMCFVAILYFAWKYYGLSLICAQKKNETDALADLSQSALKAKDALKHFDLLYQQERLLQCQLSDRLKQWHIALFAQQDVYKQEIITMNKNLVMHMKAKNKIMMQQRIYKCALDVSLADAESELILFFADKERVMSYINRTIINMDRSS